MQSGGIYIYGSMLLLLLFCSCGTQEASKAQKHVPLDSLSFEELPVAMYQGEPYTGISRACYPDGTVERETSFVMGIQEGYFKKYTQEGDLIEHNDIKAGYIECYYRLYFPGGPLKYKAAYTKGKAQGKALQYYENGKLQSSTTYRMGIPDGPYQLFFPNGTINKDGQYRAGRKEGKWQLYTSDGALYETRVYAADSLLSTELVQ